MESSQTTPPLSSHFGARCTAEGVRYRVWSPVSTSVEVEIYSGEQVCRRLPATRGAAGIFEVADPAGRAGDLYKYRLDGALLLPDPASRRQPGGVHGPSEVIDASRYEWSSQAFARPRMRDLVIYELHVGTFSPAGTFSGAIELLPTLAELGVNAIELMPIGDFDGDRGWGYDGVSLFAPARCYGRPDDLRALVDAAHAVGIAVLLDVVYNHFGPSGNYLASFIGNFLDEGAKTPWGGAIRYDAPEFAPLRYFILSNLEYWMDDFQIDGFRFDATHAIFDSSDWHLLAEATELIHRRGGYAIAEDPRNDHRLIRRVGEGGLGFDAVWADDFHHIIRVMLTQEREAYYADFQGTSDELAAALQCGWLYSGQMSTVTGRPRGTSAESLHPHATVQCISNHDQVGNRAFGERLSHSVPLPAYRVASALICLSPHTPMLFMGQEWAASTPFLFFTDHEGSLGQAISKGRREEFRQFRAFQHSSLAEQIPDPQALATFEQSKLDWDERERNQAILALYRYCLALRREESAFRPTDANCIWSVAKGASVGVLGLDSSDAQWLLLFDLLGGNAISLADLRWQLSPERWERVFSTEEERFGGDGPCALAADFASASFGPPELVVLRQKK